ncbi:MULTISPECIES: dsRBD fold-containing protein [unclassified Streptomyces]|uniref:dsRBD fold-containing protein n=1 Tax=unclassified Streptomyces TaxID=2593676 RepID=UPI00278C71F3|nr:MULTISPECIES: dsRBD fold-containing protein [unclassified Streptomyces]
MTTKEWTVRIHLVEDGDVTRARAELTVPGSSMKVFGHGSARRNPVDRPVPEIGDELAVGRALEDLALHVHDVAVDDFVDLAGPVDPVRRDDHSAWWSP